MPYMNEWQRKVDSRIAAMEERVFGKAKGPDGTLDSKAACERSKAEADKAPNAPATYHQPIPGVNRASRSKK